MCAHFSQDVTSCDNSYQFRGIFPPVPSPPLNLRLDSSLNSYQSSWTSAESDAATGAVQRHTSCFRRPHIKLSILPPSRSRSIVIKKAMSTPLQGASGPSGHAGLRSVLGQPTVSGNGAASEPALISLQQISPEQSVFREIRTLIVRLLVGALGLMAKKLPGASTPWKH